MFKNIIYSLTILLVVFMVPTVFAFAHGLVPCGGGDDAESACNLCYLYVMGQSMVNFLMYLIAPALAVLVIAWGGFNVLIAGGSAEKKQSGFRAIKTAIIGLLIVFGAWVIINEFLLFFSQQGQSDGVAKVFNSPWTKVECKL